MDKSFREMYLDTLRTFEDWVIVSEWAQRFSELHPELLEKANREAENQASDTTGMREIAARIGSIISQGGYEGRIEIDTSERPRKVRYIPEDKRVEHEKQDIEDDIAPLRRDERIKLAVKSFGTHEKYRADEFDSIARQLKQYFGLDFEVDHAQALLNQESPGEHHPDNLQLLLKTHNGKKNNSNWQRFCIDEQVEYIEAAIRLQAIVAPRFGVELENQVLGALLKRIKDVY